MYKNKIRRIAVKYQKKIVEFFSQIAKHSGFFKADQQESQYYRSKGFSRLLKTHFLSVV